MAQLAGAVEYTASLQRVGGLFGFYGIFTFVGYLMPNPFLYK